MSLCTCIFRKDERPRKKSHGEGTDKHTIPPWTDIATTRKNRLKGRFFEKTPNPPRPPCPPPSPYLLPNGPCLIERLNDSREKLVLEKTNTNNVNVCMQTTLNLAIPNPLDFPGLSLSRWFPGGLPETELEDEEVLQDVNRIIMALK